MLKTTIAIFLMVTSVSVLQDAKGNEVNFSVENRTPKTRVLSNSEMIYLDKEVIQHKKLDPKEESDFSKWVEIVKNNRK